VDQVLPRPSTGSSATATRLRRRPIELACPERSDVHRSVPTRGPAAARTPRADEASFFADAQSKLSTENLALVRKLYDFTKKSADQVEWGTGKGHGSFNAKFAGVSQKSLYSVISDGSLDLNHGWLNDLPQSEKCRAVFLKELNKIPGLSIRTDSFRPRVSIETWGPVVDMFLAAVRRVISTGTEKLSVRSGASPVASGRTQWGPHLLGFGMCSGPGGSK